MPAVLPSKLEEMSFRSRLAPDHILRWNDQSPYYSLSSSASSTDHLRLCRQWVPSSPHPKIKSTTEPHDQSRSPLPQDNHLSSSTHHPMSTTNNATTNNSNANIINSPAARRPPARQRNQHPSPTNPQRRQPQQRQSPSRAEPTLPLHKTASSSMLMVHGFAHNQHPNKTTTKGHQLYNYGHVHPTYQPHNYQPSPQINQHNSPIAQQQRNKKHGHHQDPNSNYSHTTTTPYLNSFDSSSTYTLNSIHSHNFDNRFSHLPTRKFNTPPPPLPTAQPPPTLATPCNTHLTTSAPTFQQSSQISPPSITWSSDINDPIPTTNHQRPTCLSISSISDFEQDHTEGTTNATNLTGAVGKRKRTRRGRRGGKNRRRYQNRLANDEAVIKTGGEAVNNVPLHTNPITGDELPAYSSSDDGQLNCGADNAAFSDEELLSQLVQLMAGGLGTTSSDGPTGGKNVTPMDHPNYWPSLTPEFAVDPPRIPSSFRQNDLLLPPTRSIQHSSSADSPLDPNTQTNSNDSPLLSAARHLIRRLPNGISAASPVVTNDPVDLPQFTLNNQFPHSLDFSMDPLDPLDPLLLGLDTQLSTPQRQLQSDASRDLNANRDLAVHYRDHNYQMSLTDNIEDEQKIIDTLTAIAAAQQQAVDIVDPILYPPFPAFPSRRIDPPSLDPSNDVPYPPSTLSASRSEPHQLHNLTIQERLGRTPNPLDLLAALKF